MSAEPLRLTDHREPIQALISPAQRDLLRWLKELGWGAAEVKVRNGEPEVGEKTKQTVVFGG